MPRPISLTFLGTGNALTPLRDWNSFVVDERVLVEPSPTVLPNLRQAGLDPNRIDAVFISHFHADHTFGWPFLLLEYLIGSRRRADGWVVGRQSDLWVVGPPGVEARLEEMIRVAAYQNVVARAREVRGFPLHFVEVDERAQEAGPIRFRAVRVEHAPELDCFGYLFDLDGRTVGYSGDTQLCAGLKEIATASDLLVLECSLRHGVSTPGHMTPDDVRALRRDFPDLPFILSHLSDEDVAAHNIPGARVPTDLERIDF